MHPAVIVPTFACRCLNIRIKVMAIDDFTVAENVQFMRPTLVDQVFNINSCWKKPSCFLACLLCQTLVCRVGFDSPNREPIFAGAIQGCFLDSFSFDCLSGKGVLKAMASPHFSPTFQVLLNISPLYGREAVDSELHPSRDGSLFGISEISDLFDELSTCVTEHIGALQSDATYRSVACQSEKANHHRVDLEERRIISELEILLRQILPQYLLKPGFSRGPGKQLSSLACTAPLSFTYSPIDTRPTHAPQHTFPIPVVRSTKDPAPHPCGFHDLPPEISLIIFHYLLPVPPPSSEWHAKRIYRRRRFLFSRLALVSRSWEQLIHPLLFRHLVIFARDDSAQRLLVALPRHGSHVQTVRAHSPVKKFGKRYIKPGIGECLLLMPHVHTLECYDDQIFFTKLGWLQNTAPHLLSTLKSLAFDMAVSGYYDQNLSSALVDLGPEIETLCIRSWRPSPEPVRKFYLPQEIPRLSRIALHHGRPLEDNVYALFSRVTDKTRKVSPLRELRLLEVLTLDVNVVVNILRINDLSLHLTSLHVRLTRASECRSDAYTLPLIILQLCPSLEDFSYTSPASFQIFTHLPNNLRSLEIAMVTSNLTASQKTISTSSIIDYVTSGQARNLHRLSVVRRSCRKLSPRDLNIWTRLNSWDGLDVLQLRCQAANILLRHSSRVEVLDTE